MLLYTYLGYPLLLKLFASGEQIISSREEASLPPVTLVIAAHNEEKWINQKIQNCLSLSYPSGLLNIIVVDDGSNDRTAALVQNHTEVQLIQHKQRSGKASALNTAMAAVQTPFVVFSDANCLLQKDALLQIMPLFASEIIGGVGGQKQLHAIADQQTAADTEANYWQYESWVKTLESSFYTIVGATGELLAIRTHLYKSIPERIITDDFFISMQVQAACLRFRYAPKAIADEFVSHHLLDEWKRKIRISAGGFQSLPVFLPHLNPLRDPRFAFQFFSHRILRWVVSVPALLLFFLSGTALCILEDSQLYLLCFTLQSSFLVLALLGCVAAFRRASFLFSFPFYFLFMHAALIGGLFSLLSGKQTVLWNKASR